MNKAVGVSREEMTLPYYKFFEQPLAEIPAYKLEILKSGPSALPAVPFEQHNLFLVGEDTDFCQLGYGIMPDGTGFVCNQTYMPGVTGEMLDWWFWTPICAIKSGTRKITILHGLTGQTMSATQTCR